MSEVNTTAVILARFDSERLPGKALQEIGDRSLLERVIRQMKRVRFVDEIILATTTRDCDDELAALAQELGIDVYRGACDDVLGRVARAIEDSTCETVVVAYGDNPLLEPRIVELLVSFRDREQLDYAWMPGLPLGADVGVFSRSSIEYSDCEAGSDGNREHLNAYISEHPELFKFGRVAPPADLARADLRLTVDTEADLQLMRDVEQELSRRNAPLELTEVLALAAEQPEMFVVNADVEQNFATEDWERMRSGGTLRT